MRSQPVGQRRPDLVRVGGVEHGQRHAEGAGDHLGRQRRAAHAGQHHVVEVGQLVAQLGQLRQQLPAAPEGVHPAEPDLRLGLGVRAPQRGVLLGQQRRARRASTSSARTGVGRAGDLAGAPDGQPAAARPRILSSWLPPAVGLHAASSSSASSPRTSPRPRAPGLDHVVVVDADRRRGRPSTSAAGS